MSPFLIYEYAQVFQKYWVWSILWSFIVLRMHPLFSIEMWQVGGSIIWAEPALFTAFRNELAACRNWCWTYFMLETYFSMRFLENKKNIRNHKNERKRMRVVLYSLDGFSEILIFHHFYINSKFFKTRFRILLVFIYYLERT